MDVISNLLKRKKSPKELVNSCTTNLNLIAVEGNLGNLEDKESKGSKAITEISRNLLDIRELLYSNDYDNKKQDLTELAKEFYQNDILYLLISNLSYLSFEARKDVEKIFTNLLKIVINGKSTTVDYIYSNPKVLELLLEGYSTPIYLICGSILRETFKHEILCKAVLNLKSFYNFFEYINVETFDVASDGFLSLKGLLLNKTTIIAEFLTDNFDKFFKEYNKLISSKYYVPKRQSLKILSEVLTDRTNLAIMKKYLSFDSNLKIIMNSMVNKANTIKIEAFYVFKLFVYNPKKPDSVKVILKNNKDKLISFLTDLKSKNDPQFDEEKEIIITKIKEIN